jgi:hypothetical protein
MKMSFDETKARIIRTAPGSAGDNLIGMRVDFEHYLESSGLFTDIAVRIDPEIPGVLNATGRVVDIGLTEVRLEGALVAIWQQFLRYRSFEAHDIASTESETTLRFITQIDVDGFFVTGAITIQRM